MPEDLCTKLEKFRGWKAWERESLAPDASLFASNRGTPLSTGRYATDSLCGSDARDSTAT